MWGQEQNHKSVQDTSRFILVFKNVINIKHPLSITCILSGNSNGWHLYAVVSISRVFERPKWEYIVSLSLTHIIKYYNGRSFFIRMDSISLLHWTVFFDYNEYSLSSNGNELTASLELAAVDVQVDEVAKQLLLTRMATSSQNDGFRLGMSIS